MIDANNINNYNNYNNNKNLTHNKVHRRSCQPQSHNILNSKIYKRSIK